MPPADAPPPATVQRYEPGMTVYGCSSCRCSMKTHPDGTYVTHAAYAALEERNAALVSSINGCAQRVQALQADLAAAHAHADDCEETMRRGIALAEKERNETRLECDALMRDLAAARGDLADIEDWIRPRCDGYLDGASVTGHSVLDALKETLTKANDRAACHAIGEIARKEDLARARSALGRLARSLDCLKLDGVKPKLGVWWIECTLFWADADAIQKALADPEVAEAMREVGETT